MRQDETDVSISWHNVSGFGISARQGREKVPICSPCESSVVSQSLSELMSDHLRTSVEEVPLQQEELCPAPD